MCLALFDLHLKSIISIGSKQGTDRSQNLLEVLRNLLPHHAFNRGYLNVLRWAAKSEWDAAFCLDEFVDACGNRPTNLVGSRSGKPQFPANRTTFSVLGSFGTRTSLVTVRLHIHNRNIQNPTKNIEKTIRIHDMTASLECDGVWSPSLGPAW